MELKQPQTSSDRTAEYAFNRTSMELKLNHPLSLSFRALSFNRTSMESKLIKVGLRHAVSVCPFNRTSMESKPTPKHLETA